MTQTLKALHEQGFLEILINIILLVYSSKHETSTQIIIINLAFSLIHFILFKDLYKGIELLYLEHIILGSSSTSPNKSKTVIFLVAWLLVEIILNIYLKISELFLQHIIFCLVQIGFLRAFDK